MHGGKADDTGDREEVDAWREIVAAENEVSG